MRPRLLAAAAVLGLFMSWTALAEESVPAERQSIRLFVQQDGQRAYLSGYQWISLRTDQKIIMVERARQGALRLGALMVLPAEIYVRELDRLFTEHPHLRKIEVGQAVEGIAISLKDWNTGSRSEPREVS